MRKFIKKIYLNVQIQICFVSEAIYFWHRQVKFNASSNTDKDKEKMQYTLLRENHTIEKGMSLRNPRKGFGQTKVLALLKRLEKYVTLYWNEEDSFIVYPINTIFNYIEFTKSNRIHIPEIEQAFNKLLKMTNVTPQKGTGGISVLSKEFILSKCQGNFEDLLRSRHSIRYFAENIPEKAVIEKALKMAQMTPSACNRQGWKTHVFFGDDSIDLLKWQGGSRGFEEEIRCSILVSANQKAFLSYEVHQAYVDGGLYAMNLINSLHSLGLGCIPLSVGFRTSKLKELRQFDIPDSEIPILIIGVGNLLEEFNVAISERKNIALTNTYH